MSDARVLAVIMVRCAQMFVKLTNQWLKTGESPV